MHVAYPALVHRFFNSPEIVIEPSVKTDLVLTRTIFQSVYNLVYFVKIMINRLFAKDMLARVNRFEGDRCMRIG
jgi:hypothetical protein